MIMDCNNKTPRLRFPGFSGEWEEKKLGECLLQMPEYGISAPAVPFSKNLPLYLRITDISDDGQYIREGKVSVDAVLTKENSLQDGDIVLARTGASVGKSYKYRIEDGPFIFAGFLIRIKPDETQLNSEFLFQFLQTSEYKKWVEATSTRSGQPGINCSEISSLFVPFPTLPEQQKIAECLMAMDQLISAESAKVDALKEKKKGLMQRMFPQQGEKTPRLRFPGFSGEWEYINGNELFGPISNKNHNSDLPILALTQEQGAVPREKINYNVIVSDKSVEGYKVVEVGDFIISLRSFQGGIEYSRYKGLCSPAYIER